MFVGPIDPIAIAVDRAGLVYVASTQAKTSRWKSSKSPSSLPKGPRRAMRNAVRSMKTPPRCTWRRPDAATSSGSSTATTAISSSRVRITSAARFRNVDPAPGLIAFDHLGHYLDCTVPQGLGAITTGFRSDGHHRTASPSSPPQREHDQGLQAARSDRSDGRRGAVSEITEHSANIHGEVGPGLRTDRMGVRIRDQPLHEQRLHESAGGTPTA